MRVVLSIFCGLAFAGASLTGARIQDPWSLRGGSLAGRGSTQSTAPRGTVGGPAPVTVAPQQFLSPEPLPDYSLKHGVITGGVVHGGTDLGLTRVLVELIPAERISLDTLDLFDEERDDKGRRFEHADENGRFRFSEIPPGRYTLVATRDGFLRQGYGQTGVNQYGGLFVVEAGKTIEDVVLRMFPAPTITGIVGSPDQTPLAAATVHAYRIRWTAFGRELTLVQTALTNDRGEYRLYWLSPGSYFVAASYSRQSKPARPTPEDVPLTPNLAGPDDGYPTLYFPGESTPDRAKIVRIDTSDVPGVNILLKGARKTFIRGRVVGPLQSLSKLRVTLLLRDGNPVPGLNYIPVDSDGQFEIPGLLTGEYVILAQAEDRMFIPEKQMFSDVLPVYVPERGVEGLVVPLKDGFLVTADILIDRGREAVKGRLEFCRHGSFIPTEKNCFGTLSYRFEDSSRMFFLPVDNMTVRVVLPDDVTVNDMRPDRFTVEDLRRLEPLKPATQQPTPPCQPRICLAAQRTLSVSAARGGNIVEGVVQTIAREPASRAQVILIPRSTSSPPALVRYRAGAADNFGHFEIDAVPSGEYRALAFEELEPGAYFEPGFLERWQSRTVPITVSRPPRGNASIRLSLPVELQVVTREEANR